MTKPRKTARRKRADSRYAAAVKASRATTGRGKKAVPAEASEPEAADEPEAPAEGQDEDNPQS